MIRRIAEDSRGFTLIEVIVMIIISSILSAALVQVAGTALTSSTTPLKRFQAELVLRQTMENFYEHFLRVYKPDEDLAKLKKRIGKEGKTKSNTYGDYIVVYNRFITFDADDNEIEGGTSLLKVVIKNSYGSTVSQLFSLY